MRQTEQPSSHSEKIQGKDTEFEKIFGNQSFRQIVEKIQDVLYVNDYLGNFLYMNPTGFQLLGYSPEKFYEMNYLDIFPDNYKQQVFDFYSNQLKYGLEKTYQEIPIKCEDGKLLWFGQNVTRVELNGKVFFYGLARDITDRLKIEAALRESEEKYRTILENMEEGYFEVNMQGDFIFFNKSLLELFNRFTMSEFTNINYRKVMDDKNASYVFNEFNEVYNTGKPREIRFTVVNRNSEQRRFETTTSPIRDHGGKITGFRGIARDITEKEKTLEDLRQSLLDIELSERKYRLIAENSTDIIWVLDRKTLKFTYVSPAVEKIRGYTVDEAMAENLDTVFPQDELSRILSIFSEEIEKEKTGSYDPDRQLTFETRELKKNGHEFWVEVTARFLRDENGQVIAAQGSTRDISHRKQVEQERDKFADALTAARLVQQEILPQKSPASDIVEIAFRYLPLEQVGGDYFTFVDYKEHDSIGVFIGDVSGHGVPAALYTMTVKAVTDRLFRKYNLNPPRFLEELNKEMHQAMSKHFLTGIYGFFSYGDLVDTVNFHFSKGGHPYPAYYNSVQKSSEYLESKGRAMGFFDDEKYEGRNVTLNRGDRIYLYTDGLFEVTDMSNRIFGLERFLNTINEANTQITSLDETLDFIVKAVTDFNPLYEQEDDMVIIGIEIR